MTRRTFHLLPPKENYPSRKALETKTANRHCKKTKHYRNRSFYNMFITEIEIWKRKVDISTKAEKIRRPLLEMFCH